MLASVGVYTRGFIVHTRSYYARQRDLQFVANSHALLLEALLTREPDRAEQAVHAHIQSALASLTAASNEVEPVAQQLPRGRTDASARRPFRLTRLWWPPVYMSALYPAAPEEAVMQENRFGHRLRRREVLKLIAAGTSVSALMAACSAQALAATTSNVARATLAAGPASPRARPISSTSPGTPRRPT